MYFSFATTKDGYSKISGTAHLKLGNPTFASFRGGVGILL